MTNNFYINILFSFTALSKSNNFITFCILTFVFAILIVSLAYIISNLRKPNLLKRTEGFETYEFGATSIGNSSLLAINKHYYVLGILFIIFDIELMFLYP